MTQIQINQKISTNLCSDKPTLKKLAQTHNLLQNWKTITNVTVKQLADYIGKGYAVRAGIRMHGNKAEDVESVSWLFIDLDHSTIEESLQCPISQFAAFYYYTFSYIPGENEKHRLVFKLDRQVSATEYEKLATYIIKKFYPKSDEIFSPGSLFFGTKSPDYVHILNE